MKNLGYFNAQIKVTGKHADGKSFAFTSRETIHSGKSGTLDLADTNGIVRDGDSIRISFIVSCGLDISTRETFIYKKTSLYEANFISRGTTLTGKYTYDSRDIKHIQKNQSVRWISLKNKGVFSSKIRIIGKHLDGTSYSHTISKNIFSYAESTIDLAELNKTVLDGDIVQLEAVVSLGNDNRAPLKFIYSPVSSILACYTISGTLQNNTMQLTSLMSKGSTEQNPALTQVNYDDSELHQTYDMFVTSPKNACTNFSNDIRGICHGKKHWFISHNSTIDKSNQSVSFCEIIKIDLEKSLYENSNYTNTKKITAFLYRNGYRQQYELQKLLDSNQKILGLKIPCFSIGDIECYNGYIFAPIYRSDSDSELDAQIVIFSAETLDFVYSEKLYTKEGRPFTRIDWCAINPNDNCLYSSENRLLEKNLYSETNVFAFRINFDSIYNRNGIVFTNITHNGIQLQTPDQKNFPIILGIQGGCFDQYDNIYLASKAENDENGGIVVFRLNRNIDSIFGKYVNERAFHIWNEKNRPVQPAFEQQEDWLNAHWQIKAAMNYGQLNFNEIATKAISFMEINESGHLVSSLDFSESEYSTVYPEEPRGITYWDLRRTGNYKKNPDYFKAPLHVLQIVKDDEYSLKGSNSFGMKNYNITSVDTNDIIIDYDPNKLSLRQNPISQRWTIISNGYNPVLDFENKDVAEKAIKVAEHFCQVVILGSSSCKYEEFDFSHALLQKPIKTIATDDIASFHFDYESAIVTGLDIGRTKVQNKETELINQGDGYLFFWATRLINHSSSQMYHIQTYNEPDAWKIHNSASDKKRFCILQDDDSCKHELCWFE